MAEVPDQQTLKQVFQSGWEAQRKVESGEITPNTEDYKLMVRDGVSSLERATVMVNQLSLFSSNESIEELPTADLRYLLLPALLGELTLQQAGDARLEHLHKARVYFTDYLKRAQSYAITQDPGARQVGGAEGGGARTDAYKQAAEARETKIARLRARREMEKKIETLAERLKSCEDEDTLREHLLATLNYWVIRCQESLLSTDQEIELLEGMGRLSTAPGNYRPPPPSHTPRPPITITRDMVQAQVFGAGYPSLPAMSIEQFFDQQYGEGSGHTSSPAPQPEPEQDSDSEEAIQRAREYDDFKDYNRRGTGNRKNMG